MGRAKVKCRGKNLNGFPCNNWAIKGSLYCQLHVGQETSQDREMKKEAEGIAGMILVGIVVIVFAFSSCLGCEDEFFKWLGN